MCPIKSFWKEKQRCISLFLLLLLMIICITPGSQVFGHVSIVNSWRTHQIAVVARRLEEDGEWWPFVQQFDVASSKSGPGHSTGCAEWAGEQWLCPGGSLEQQNSSVQGLNCSTQSCSQWGERTEEICLWWERCWTFPLFGISSLKSSSVSWFR